MENVFYDKNFLEIGDGDLLKVYHFRSRNKKYYMYHVACYNAENNVWEIKDYNQDGRKGHYRLHPSMSFIEEGTRRYLNAEIIYKKDWENHYRLKREARKRRSLHNPITTTNN